MCVDPLTLLGMGLSVAGSAAQASSAASYTNAVNKANADAYAISKAARDAELARQKTYETQASDYWNTTSKKMDAANYETNQQQAADQFMTAYDGMDTAIASGELLSGQGFASDEVKADIAASANKAAAEARQRIAALAKLSGGATTAQGRSIGLNENANQLGIINSLRQGSLGVSQQEQNISPATVTKGSTIMGDILSGVGGLATQYGSYKSGINGA